MISGFLLLFLFSQLSVPQATIPRLASSQRTLSGYLLLTHEYTAPSLGTALNRLRVAGRARLDLLPGRLSLQFSSRHWFTFRHIEQHILAQPYENRHLLQSLTLEGRNLLLKGMEWRIGRLFPSILYAASPLLDGGELSFSFKGWRGTMAAGKAVDVWNGSEAPGDFHMSGGISFSSNRLQTGFSFYQGRLSSQVLRELGGGFSLNLGAGYFVNGQVAWDVNGARLARSSGALVKRYGLFDISLQGTLWRSPAGRYMTSQDDTALPALPTLGNEEYRDLRLNLAWHRGDFSVSASGGVLAGIRQGSLASFSLQAPRVWGVHTRIIAHYLDSSYMLFYALEARISGRIGALGIELQSQSRLYHWKERPEGWWNSDNHTLVQVDIPIAPKILLLLEGGMVFRATATDTSYPMSSVRLLWRF